VCVKTVKMHHGRESAPSLLCVLELGLEFLKQNPVGLGVHNYAANKRIAQMVRAGEMPLAVRVTLCKGDTLGQQALHLEAILKGLRWSRLTVTHFKMRLCDGFRDCNSRALTVSEEVVRWRGGSITHFEFVPGTSGMSMWATVPRGLFAVLHAKVHNPHFTTAGMFEGMRGMSAVTTVVYVGPMATSSYDKPDLHGTHNQAQLWDVLPNSIRSLTLDDSFMNNPDLCTVRLKSLVQAGRFAQLHTVALGSLFTDMLPIHAKDFLRALAMLPALGELDLGAKHLSLTESESDDDALPPTPKYAAHVRLVEWFKARNPLVRVREE